MNKKQNVATKQTIGKIVRKNCIDNGDMDSLRLTQSDIDYLVSVLFSAIIEAVMVNKSVVIKGFGTFKIYERKGKFYRTPTGQEGHSDSRKHLTFMPSEKLMNRLNK